MRARVQVRERERRATRRETSMPAVDAVGMLGPLPGRNLLK
jgi:hypothetical protein